MGSAAFVRLMARVGSAWRLALLRWDAWRSGGTLRLHPSLRLRIRVRFFGLGTLVIGADVVIGEKGTALPHSPVVLAPREKMSRIAIGPRTRLTNGVEFISLRGIELGADCLVGPGARIIDSDFHGVRPEERRTPGQSLPVVIGNRVWIGMSTTVLKGVRMGDDAVAGACAVVVKDVAAGAVVAGNPAHELAATRAAVKV